jgi:hypothetical protein
MRNRSLAYRERRKVRHAQRRVRMSEAADYQYMLRNTPGYADMLERYSDLERLATEWESADLD